MPLLRGRSSAPSLRRSTLVALATMVVWAIAVAGMPASASAPPVNLPTLVSQTAVGYTPNVVMPTFPDPTETQVWAYAPVGADMVACGKFTTVKSADGTQTYTRNNLFAFDPWTGAMADFAPDVDGPVYTCLASADGQHVYIGGQFTHVNGEPADNIAELDMATGQLDPSFAASADQVVTDLALVGGRLYVSGSFSTISGHTQNAFATIDPTTGAYDPFLDIDIEGRVAANSGLTRVFRFAVNPLGTSGVAIGNFTMVGGVSHWEAFRFTLQGTPRVADWDNPMFHALCGPTFNMPVWTRDVQFSPNGSFFVIDGTGGRGAGLCDTATRWAAKDRGPDVSPTWINHTCVDTLHSVAVTNRVVYVQGHQKCVMGKQGHEVPRYGIAALSASTGYALSWRSDQSRETGGKFLMITSPDSAPGFPAGLWSGCDCRAEGGVIFRPES